MTSKSNASSPKRSHKARILLAVALVLLAIALIAAGVLVYRYWSQQNAYSELEGYVELPEANTEKLADMTVDWEGLRQINPDIVAWIYIPDSNINYPVVQGSDNEKYLHTAFNGSDGWFSSAGTIFIDAKNDPNFTDRNTFLYGHHMRDGSMFAALTDWESPEQFNAHRDIYILTPKGNFYAKSFSLLKTSGSEPIVVTNFNSEENFRTYIQKMIDRSMVPQEGDVFTVDDIKQCFALCTCEYTHDDGRDLLFATVVATTVEDDPYVAADPNALTGIDKGESVTFGTDE